MELIIGFIDFIIYIWIGIIAFVGIVLFFGLIEAYREKQRIMRLDSFSPPNTPRLTQIEEFYEPKKEQQYDDINVLSILKGKYE